MCSKKEEMKANSLEVINYYNHCWLDRFLQGHNSTSLAMHMGYFTDENSDNDKAKLYANQFLSQYINLPTDREISIADFGCGVGGTCIYLASSFPLAKITGINISPDQINFAKVKTAEKGLSKSINYLVADYSDTNLPSASFDFVIGIESICHAIDKTSVYKEAFRILKPNGVFAFMDYFELTQPQNPEQKKLIEDFRTGWVVDRYINEYFIPIEEEGFRDIIELSITEKVMRGVIHSYNKAKKELDNPEIRLNRLKYSHFNACIALKKLIERGIIDYKAIRAYK